MNAFFEFVIRSCGPLGLGFILPFYLLPKFISDESLKELTNDQVVLVKVVFGFIVMAITYWLINAALLRNEKNGPGSINIKRSNIGGDVVGGNKTTTGKDV